MVDDSPIAIFITKLGTLKRQGRPNADASDLEKALLVTGSGADPPVDDLLLGQKQGRIASCGAENRTDTALPGFFGIGAGTGEDGSSDRRRRPQHPGIEGSLGVGASTDQ